LKLKFQTVAEKTAKNIRGFLLRPHPVELKMMSNMSSRKLLGWPSY